ncbi:hypothetical protein JV46_04320 [Solemya velum gill symbiont]|uniref:Uncharacterized protein n=1 Tax=Solemya velum gill symbiont TaxID=2340 RepID=A0A0B0H777_SOVGS|nr:hypothetical protein JV46_04320 [Solemya velum gill symbiont]
MFSIFIIENHGGGMQAGETRILALVLHINCQESEEMVIR